MMKKLLESSRVNKKLIADLDIDIWEIALASFIKNTSNEINNINNSFNKQDFNQIKSIAHKLAGSAIVVGLEKFSAIAKKIELKPINKITKKNIETLNNEFLLIQELAK